MNEMTMGIPDKTNGDAPARCQEIRERTHGLLVYNCDAIIDALSVGNLPPSLLVPTLVNVQIETCSTIL